MPPTDPILVLGMLEGEPEDIDSTMVRDLFGVAKKSQLQLFRPDEVQVPSLPRRGSC